MGEGEGGKEMTDYKTKVESLNPVAIKLDQHEVHAPGHDNWRVLACDQCEDKFALGPNRIYGSRTTEEECVKQLVTILAAYHQHKRPHQNNYDLVG